MWSFSCLLLPCRLHQLGPSSSCRSCIPITASAPGSLNPAPISRPIDRTQRSTQNRTSQVEEIRVLVELEEDRAGAVLELRSRKDSHAIGGELGGETRAALRVFEGGDARRHCISARQLSATVYARAARFTLARLQQVWVRLVHWLPEA